MGHKLDWEQARYRGTSDKRRNPRRAFGSSFDRLRTGVAEHSTESWAKDAWPGKWGTEAQEPTLSEAEGDPPKGKRNRA